MKSMIRTVSNKNMSYSALLFACPGCISGGPDGYDGIHMLAVNSNTEIIGTPSWAWDGNLDAPTLSPSILSQGYCRCHSFLKAGIFEFLTDSDHPLSGQSVPIPDLPDWAVEMDHG